MKTPKKDKWKLIFIHLFYNIYIKAQLMCLVGQYYQLILAYHSFISVYDQVKTKYKHDLSLRRGRDLQIIRPGPISSAANTNTLIDM